MSFRSSLRGAEWFPSSRPVPRKRFFPEVFGLEDRSLLSTFTVTNTSGDASTQGSLPWAIQQSNYSSPGLDIVKFNLQGAAPFIIDVNSTLYLNDQVVIDGESQPGYAGKPLVVVRGNASVPSIFLLQGAGGQTSSGSTIQGLAMSNYTANAVTIFTSSQGNWIQNNYMGFYYDGSNTLHTNKQFTSQPAAGVGLQSSFNTIRFNTMSGLYNGVNIGQDIGGSWSGAIYKTNSIQYNNIGTDPTGSTASGFGNDSDGVFLAAGAQENFIGPGDVLSGNKSSGVELLHPSTKLNVVFANMIGLDKSGMTAIPNGELGVLIANGSGSNAVGGPFGGNVIAANPLGGISLGTASFPGAPGNWVQNNIVGLNVAQTAVVGTQAVGINVESGASANSITGNIVAGNSVNGFQVSNATGNYMASNFIGQASSGVWFPNKGFGVALLPKANSNWVVSNTFGSNGQGSIYVDSAAVGNALQDVPGIVRPGGGGKPKPPRGRG
ncbi:MAG: NosD domain-containing protein [Paludisphaera borealis]|uniref:NosD domain-containing protein n=1 Tax=Paludisphaera borealis TaxID=1387353 RepID=UPI00284BE6EE|nr:NosD domain-containing protein [Paludisphaera borealis]MDR3622068.1 NosD domain-containing protein [Paludisphaera borealis]